MPQPKKRQRSEEDDAEDVKPSLKGSEPVGKKEKKEVEESSAVVDGIGQVHTNDRGDKYIQLAKHRRLTVSKYQNRTLIDLREYYTDKTTGEWKPGTKGVSLTPEQWAIVKDNVSVVDDLLKKISK